MAALMLLLLFYVDKTCFAVSETEYGPYNVKFGDYTVCHGSKPADAGSTRSELFNDEYGYTAVINITFFGAVSIDEVRLIINNVQGSKKKPLWSYNMPKPCQHFAVSAIIAEFIHNNKCIAKNGSVSVTLNLTDISYTFFGKSFFYGLYNYKALVSSKKGNILCLSLTSIITKKN